MAKEMAVRDLGDAHKALDLFAAEDWPILARRELPSSTITPKEELK